MTIEVLLGVDHRFDCTAHNMGCRVLLAGEVSFDFLYLVEVVIVTAGGETGMHLHSG